MLAVLAYTLLLFCASMATHIAVWRTLPVRNEVGRLVLIFCFLPALSLALCLATGAGGLPWSAWFLVYLMHCSLSVSYMLLYTAVTGFSPSIAILEKVEKHMPNGLPRDQLVPEWFTDENFSGARQRNLIGGGLICKRDGRLYLESRGRCIARCFLLYRRFLGLTDLAKG